VDDRTLRHVEHPFPGYPADYWQRGSGAFFITPIFWPLESVVSLKKVLALNPYSLGSMSFVRRFWG
jgi:hypothetical protein